MKSKKILLAVTLLLFSLLSVYAQYDSESDFETDKEWKTFSNIERMKTYFSLQSYNTPDTPFKIKLNINDNDFADLELFLMITAQYYYLDLSGSTITTIPNNTFASYNPSESRLTGIILPNTVTVIGKEAFRGCKTLVSIMIPDSVTVIREKAFANCGLINITIPDSVTAIEQEAFKGCENLVSVKIPNRITVIRDSVFSECRNLTDITIPDRVTYIGDFAFCRCGSFVSITIPNNVTEIGKGAFQYCFNLTGITIPDSVTSIGFEAFYDCYNLVSVTFKGTMKRELKYYTDEEKANYRKFKYYAGDDEENVNHKKFEYFDDDEENENDNFYYKSVFDEAFIGNLHEKFYEEDAEYGTPGTYAAVEYPTPLYRHGTRWKKQP